MSINTAEREQIGPSRERLAELRRIMDETFPAAYVPAPRGREDYSTTTVDGAAAFERARASSYDY